MIVRLSSSVFCASLALAALMAALGSSAAAQSPRTITVTGAGASSAWPNYAVLKGRISASGDSAAAALKAFRELRDKAEKLAKDDSKRLTVRFLGEELTQGGLEGEGPVAVDASGGIIDAVGGGIAVAEELELRIDFAGDMERAQAAESLTAVFDAAQEAGVTFGAGNNAMAMAMIGQMVPSSIAEFRLADEAAVEDEAYAAAVANARRKAEKLAALTGGKLGGVAAIEEEAVAAVNSENPYVALIASMQGGDEQHKPASSPANGRIQIRKRLRVSFALEP